MKHARDQVSRSGHARAAGKERTDFPIGRPQLPTLLNMGAEEKEVETAVKNGMSSAPSLIQAFDYSMCFPFKQ